MIKLEDLITELESQVDCKVIHTVEDGLPYGHLLILKHNETGYVISIHCSLDDYKSAWGCFSIRKEHCFEPISISQIKRWF